MGKFSLSRLVMCAKYQRLSAEDYVRLGLCEYPDQCQDCTDGSGHYVKNDKMVSMILIRYKLKSILYFFILLTNFILIFFLLNVP